MLLSTTLRSTRPFANSRRAGLIAAAGLPLLRLAEHRHLEHAIIGLGGTACVLNPLPVLFPDWRAASWGSIATSRWRSIWPPCRTVSTSAPAVYRPPFSTASTATATCAIATS